VEAPSAGDGSIPQRPCVLLIGQGGLPDATERALEAGGAEVRRLSEPSDEEIRAALDEPVDRVVVVSRFDHLSLRLALVVAHIRPDLPALVTIFDRGVAEHLRRRANNVHILSMADVVAPAFAGPCLDEGLLSVMRGPAGVGGVRAFDGEPQGIAPTWSTPGRGRRLLASMEALVRPFDPSARILVAGLFGILGVLVVETLVTMLAAGLSLIDALYLVTKVTVTVGPSTAADQGPDWFKVFSTVAILLTLGFTAVLTAGLVNRLLDPRLTGIVGRSTVPRRDHVIVVGLGQVGFRLCGLLRDLGIPLVAVEQDRDARNVTWAKDSRVPVVIANGSSQRVLRGLSVERARAVAAVTSDEVENIAIAVAAEGLCEDLNLTLRAGDGVRTSETHSLFHLGVVRDVYRIAGTALAASALGYDAHEAFPYEGTLYLVDAGGTIQPFVLAQRAAERADGGTG
jgi:voltage-gated potassium channel Kch